MQCINVIDFCWKVQSASFFRLMFANTFWVTKTYIGLYFPKLWNFMFGFSLPCFLLPPWRIKSQLYFITCSLLPPWSYHSECNVLMSSIFAERSSQPVFLGYCFQTHSGSRKHILVHIVLGFGISCLAFHYHASYWLQGALNPNCLSLPVLFCPHEALNSSNH